MRRPHRPRPSRRTQPPLLASNHWERILAVVDEVFANYLNGLVVLRRRVVDDIRRKLDQAVTTRVISAPPKRMRGVSQTRPNDGSKA